MAKFKSKAEAMFDKKMEAALENRDFVAVERVFHQFGCYLELIDPNVDLTNEQIADHSQKMTELKEV